MIGVFSSEVGLVVVGDVDGLIPEDCLLFEDFFAQETAGNTLTYAIATRAKPRISR